MPLGEQPDAAVLYCLQRRSGERRDLDEPLVGESRFHHRVATVAVTYSMLMRLFEDEEPVSAQLGDDASTRLIAIEAAQRSRNPSRSIHALIHGRVGCHHDGHGQTMPLRDVKVVGVVRGRDFERPRAECAIDVRIGNDRNGESGDREPYLPTMKRGVTRIRRMHGNRDVAEDRLGARGRHNDRLRRVIGHDVPDVVKRARERFELRLFVGERREAARTPVDDAVATIDQTVVVQSHEHLAHRARQLRAERIRCPLPVGTRSDLSQLIEDLSARQLGEGAHALHEGFAADVEPCVTLGCDLFLHHVLRGDSGVVSAGHPERFVAGHAAPADEDVLHGVVQAMPHMQHRGDVRRRNDDGEWIARPTRAHARARVGVEQSRTFPRIVQRGFGFAGIVQRRNLGRREVAGSGTQVCHVERKLATSRCDGLRRPLGGRSVA